jgi:phosphoglycolate phosphatase-like HAD superfamily hydrolase
MVLRTRRDCAALWFAWLTALLLLAGCATPAQVADPLPSWNEGRAKAAIVKLVQDTTRADSPGFVPPAERIATFDNDGTLWCEHPMYVEALFTFDRLREMAKANPAWRNDKPYKGVVDDDPAAMASLTGQEYFQIAATTHAGFTSAEYRKAASDWLAVARHPRFNRPYTDLVYQPMLEVLAYLRANGYKTFIVTGGTLDFVRAFADKAYGIPPEQVVGTSFVATYAFIDNVATLRSDPRVMLINDGPGKATGIDHAIGRIPIAAFGNSDGDIAMLETTTNSLQSRERPRLGALVWHTDGAREYAYDRDTHVGRLAAGLEAAPARGWQLLDMKSDWKVVFPFELAPR